MVIVTMVLVAIVGAFISLHLVQTSKSTKGWIAAIWAIAPPVWFWFEYSYLSTEEQKNDKNYRDRLKFAQDCASKIWVAVAGIFTASYFDALPKL
jgi:hypothetical protein